MNRTVALITALGGCVTSCATHLPVKQNWSGNYQTVDSQSDSQLTLEVRQQKDTATLNFAAGNSSGRGSAPDGNGKGQVAADGTLHFKFEDSFGNQGSGSLKPAGLQYQLILNATSIEEPRAVVHYGTRILQKSSSSLKTEH